MSESFYWYDLETSGTDPRWDRIVQFAGLRTNANLEPLGDEFVTDVALPDDVLPDPRATLITGITPRRTHAGLSEWEAFRRIHAALMTPGTCAVGYNSLRFDDEFVRFGLFRHLRDPYAREFRNGNSRWDLIDLVRAAGALRPEGINWPHDEDGWPVYRLEELTKANNLQHESAHDALSDVRATVALARLIRQAQPRLFDYYLGSRDKRAVRRLLEPYGQRVCVHVSGMYPKERYRVAPVLPICRHPVNANSVIVADLASDIEGLVRGDEVELRQALFTAGNPDRPPLKEVRTNRCPFIADISVLTPENLARTGIDLKEVNQRRRRLAQPAVLQKIGRIFAEPRNGKAEDVEASLYDRFLQDEDRSLCNDFVQEVEQGQWRVPPFRDARLPRLAMRIKARSFPELLDAAEQAEWTAFVRDKLAATRVPWRTLTAFETELAALRAEGVAPELVAQLEAHGRELRTRYGLV
ncbi:MAG: exodeoxyribonuclease I [Pseudomonadales bacterium]|nr:exodeoxyribonuclease I [Pseudomonadales bacterium]